MSGVTFSEPTSRLSTMLASRSASESTRSWALLLRITAARTAVFCRLNSSAPSAAESVTAYGLPLAMKSEALLARLEQHIVADTAQNELRIRPQIRARIGRGMQFTALNDFAYRDVFHTPKEDAWLGLLDSWWALVLVYPTFTIPLCTWLAFGFFRSVPLEIEVKIGHNWGDMEEIEV